MKRFLILVFVLFCGVAFAHTITWRDGNTTTQTTCNSGDNITPPTPIGKYGYHFKEWAEYTQIEYLEFTGTQYIDTNIIFTGTTSEIDTEFLAYQNEVDAAASVSATQQNSDARWASIQYSKFQNKIITTIGNTSADQALSFTSNGIRDHVIYSSNSTHLTVTFNGVSRILNSGGTAHTGNKLFIGCKNTAGTRSEMFIGKIYNYKLTIDGTPIRDFIPVLDKNDTPCMYDKVTKQFFNAGTGQFIAGPVLTE